MLEHRDCKAVSRIIIIGRNSTLFKRLERHLEALALPSVAIGHSDIDCFEFDESDTVWIFSYSRVETENRDMMRRLRAAGAVRCFYISTATVNCLKRTRCYSYPRCKAQAERVAQELLDAEIVRIGLIYDEELELPAGRVAATYLGSLAELLSSPPSSVVTNFFRMVGRPFRSRAERMLHKCYGSLMHVCGFCPCLLRPIDLLLKLLGFRWYGYLYLSNKLWLLDPPSEMALLLHSEVDGSRSMRGLHLSS